MERNKIGRKREGDPYGLVANAKRPGLGRFVLSYTLYSGLYVSS